jgi:hydroxymethylpyrimidine pyrophosphatase-like HAD family hydrolase
MAPVVAATGHGGVAVCGNGGLVVDLDHGQVLRAWPLPPELVTELAVSLTEAVPGSTIAVEYVPLPGRLDDGTSFGHGPDYRPRTEPGPGLLVGPVAELVTDRPVVKLLVRGPASAEADAMLALATRLIGGRAEATHSSLTDPLVEISAAGVSKGSALADYAGSLGIGPSLVATVGDMPNDVSMLEWSGASYAVTGAHPAALAAAQEQISGAEDDGVATLLERLLAPIG